MAPPFILYSVFSASPVIRLLDCISHVHAVFAVLVRGVADAINRSAVVKTSSTVPTIFLCGPCVRARVCTTFLVSVSVSKVCLLLKEVTSELLNKRTVIKT